MSDLLTLLRKVYDFRPSQSSGDPFFTVDSLETRLLLSVDVGLSALVEQFEPEPEKPIVVEWDGSGEATRDDEVHDGDPHDSDEDSFTDIDDEEEEEGGDFIDHEAYDELYGDFDFSEFLDRERDGVLGGGGGPVDELPQPADALVNNNAGVNGTIGFTQSETSVIAFGNTVLVAFNDAGSTSGGTNKFSGFARSTDGGVTFTDGGVLPTNAGGDAGDPVLVRNNTSGRIYFATLGASISTIQVFRSDDGGATWMDPVNGTPGGSGEDKEWVAVDNFDGSGNGNVYLVSRRFGGTSPGIYFFRSTDNGSTFGPTNGTFIVAASQGAFVAVGPDHSVYVFWWASTSIQMRKSTDQGATFGAPVTVATGLFGLGDLGLTGIRQGTAVASSFRSNEFPQAVVNPVNGNIYVVYANDGPGVDKADVFVVQSITGGASWAAPIKVNDDVGTTDQWQPTLAVSPTGDKLGVFYYSRQEDPTGNNLFKYYGRVASISGSTLTFGPSFPVSDTPSLPEFGRDGLANPVYMGDYDSAYATPGFFHVSWSDSRLDLANGAGRKDPNVFYKAVDLGLTVLTTTPADDAIVSSIPLSYVVTFSDAIQVASVQAADFLVDGIAANSFVVNTPTQVTFTFTSAPFTAQGLHVVALAAGAILRNSDADTLASYSRNFRYDATPLQVTATGPPVNGVFTLPTPFAYDVNFNETIDPASVQTWDLGLGGFVGAVVTNASVLPGNTSVRFTLSGITGQGTLTATIPAGAILDAFGNPGNLFSGGYSVDSLTAPYPTPLVAKDPLGSLIYDPSQTGFIGVAGDVDNFTLDVDAHQKISLIVTPTSTTLQPRIEIFDTNNVSRGFSAAAAANQIAGIETVLADIGGTYTFAVSGVGTTTGGYTLQVILNAAFELEAKTLGLNTNDIPTGSSQIINALDSGWLQANGSHTSTNNNYIVGQSLFPTTQEFRNYFTFALPAGIPTILGAELRLVNPSSGYASADPSETFSVFDVSTATAALDVTRTAGDATGISIFGDLGTGTVYGTRVVSAADNNTTVGITLNAAALTLLNSAIGSTISFGGAITTIAGGALQTMFSGTVGPGQVQLVLQIPTFLMAESIDSSFVILSTPQATADRAAVLGQTDINNYNAAGVAGTFEDISTTGTVITGLTNQDNAVASIAIGFAFPFYGVSNTTVLVTSNGLLTFGGIANLSGVNTDLTALPSTPAIAPFWDDLHTGGGVASSNVFSQVIGVGSNQHLTIQWNNVRFVTGGTAGDNITFEAQLYADGRIQFNYLDLVSGTALGNNGASATVGIKATGTTGQFRTLLAFNTGPNTFVGTGRSTLFTLPNPSPDYYAFTLTSGDVATLAIESEAPGMTLELRNSSDVLLATGVSGSTNLTRVINNFSAPGAGIYFARVFGGNGVTSQPYNLVVTRNAAFDTEDNNTAATAQSLDGNRGVLGQTGSVGPFLYGSTRAGQLFTINLSTGAVTLVGNLPVQANEIEFDSLTGRAFVQAPDGAFFGQEFNINTGAGIGSTINNGASFNGMEWVGSTLYATAIPGPSLPSTLRILNPFAGTSSTIGATGFGPISGLAYDSTSGIMYGITGGQTGNLLRLNLTTGVATLIGPTGFRAGSLEFGPDGLLYGGGTGTDEFKIFRIDPATGTSTLLGLTGIGPTGGADVTGLALVSSGSDDWYSITLPGTVNALRLQTSTPGDESGEPVNTLNPRIDLFDNTGATLISTGVEGLDGRNESIVALGLTPGATYKLRVSGENGTRGEYFLSRNFDFSPVVTSLSVQSTIDEDDTATLNATFTDLDSSDTHTVVITWGSGEGSTTLTLAAGVLSFTASHQYLDDKPSGTPSDSYTVTVAVLDNSFGTDSDSTTLTVNNVAPDVAPISGSSSGVRGQALSFSGAFSDVGSLDTHEVRWDFGDGTVIDFHSSADPNALGPSAHVYTTSGTYTLTLSVRDDDTGLTSISKSITISSVALQGDPGDSTKTALVVGGSQANDTIVVNPQSNLGDVNVSINGVSQGTFRPTGHIIVYGQDGDDDIQIANSIALDAWLYGDAGNDRLKGGAGASILFGGDGDDQLNGGSGRSILIGGRGSDRLVGGSGDDVLIAGYVLNDRNAGFLYAFQNLWKSADGYSVRVNRLRLLLNGFIIIDDGGVDVLTGASGLDWYFMGLSDVITGNLNGESVG